MASPLHPTPAPARARLGDLLVQANAISRDVLERVAAQALHDGIRIGEALVHKGLVEERTVYRSLAAQFGLPFDVAETLLEIADASVAKNLNRKFLEREHVLPVARVSNRLVVATSEPSLGHDDLGHALGVATLDRRVVTPTDLRRIRSALDLQRVGHVDAAPELSAELTGGSDLVARTATGLEPKLVALFESILLDAIGERASDIHLERYGGRVRVRIRVDGDLRDLERYRLDADQLAGLVNVLKIRAQLDIAERRAPQGGRFATSAGGKAFDLRVQTQPALWGEHAVIRLLPQEQKPLQIEDLGFGPEAAAAYRRLLDSPQGLVLVVGPTGSGKSTTLYAGLQVLAQDGARKVITVEDPIEYAIDRVQQTQVHPELGFAFASAMRAFVREDPDVILVGEIRDGETALEGLRASQTGHLVLSTLHCNDAVDAVQRLLDLGMHPNSIASELLAVFAQRLAKRVCPQCRAPVAPEPALLAEVFPRGLPADFRCFRGRGCDACGGHGTHGRIAVVEHLPAGPEVRRAIARALAVDDLRDVARKAGLRPLREEALRLVQDGLIAFEELPSLLPPDLLAGDGAR